MSRRLLVVLASAMSLQFAAAGVAQEGTSAARAPGAPSAVPPARTATPRLADGKPDLSGWWMPLPQPGDRDPRVTFEIQTNPDEAVVRMGVRNADFANLVADHTIHNRRGDNLPLYKPEYWDKVRELDLYGTRLDPYVTCKPLNTPRTGAPTRIVQTATDLIFMYQIIFQGNDSRVIPYGPRTRPVSRDGTWRGDPIAHWEGDTLVVEYEGFNDQSWIEAQGYLHGYELKVTERYRRQGNTLLYDVTVEDPEYLQQAWVLPTRTYVEMPPALRFFEDAPPCDERDSEHQVGRVREF